MESSRIPVIKIQKPGIYCCIQDFGRFGFRHLGIPCSGASDRMSMISANAKLQNKPNAPVLEIFGQNVVIEILSPVRLAMAGATSIISVDSKTTDFNQPQNLTKGQVLHIEKLLIGYVTYVAIEGGFDEKPVMGSVAPLSGTYLKPLTKDSILFKTMAVKRQIEMNSRLVPIQISMDAPIKVSPGPEFNLLDDEAIRTLLHATFVISKTSSRMGYRLIGPSIIDTQKHEMLSSAVTPGVVQWLPDGQLIILMRDCQTTGGYPRILVVEEHDINQLAQRCACNEVKFFCSEATR
jgi:biotin-dependent carboxylase-like uncharacterized protein